MKRDSIKCPLCGESNNPSFPHCYKCGQELRQAVSQAEKIAFEKKKGLPVGVIVYIVIVSIGLIFSLRTFFSMSFWTSGDWFNLSITVIMTFVSILVVVGLFRAKEWGRRLAILQLTLGIGTMTFTAFHPERILNAPQSKQAFDQFIGEQRKDFEAGLQDTFSEEEARRDLREKLSNKNLIYGTSIAISFINLLWIAYFMGPVKRRFHVLNAQVSTP